MEIPTLPDSRHELRISWRSVNTDAAKRISFSQTADLLGVSRSHVIKLLEAGQIAFRQVGTKRRVPISDLLRYGEENKAHRLATLAKLQAQAQELNMGY